MRSALLLREREYHHLLPVNCPFSLWSACTFKDHFMPHLCLDISLKRMGNRCYLGKCPFCDSAQWRGAFLSSPNLHWIVSLGIIFILPCWLGKGDMMISGDSMCDGRWRRQIGRYCDTHMYVDGSHHVFVRITPCAYFCKLCISWIRICSASAWITLIYARISGRKYNGF